MKVYVTNKGVTLVGKGWQVKTILKQYMKKYETIEQWRNELRNIKVDYIRAPYKPQLLLNKKTQDHLDKFFPSF